VGVYAIRRLFSALRKPLLCIGGRREIEEGIAERDHLGVIQAIDLPGQFRGEGADPSPEQAADQIALPFLATLLATLMQSFFTSFLDPFICNLHHDLPFLRFD
jgi:hypothetical protein